MICFLPRGQGHQGCGGLGDLSLSPGSAEAARFLHPGEGRSCRPPLQLRPLLPGLQGNLEEHSHARVTHRFT